MKSTPIKTPPKQCVLCGAQFSGYGNNPAPIKRSGQCCDLCNVTKVIPYRMAPLMMEMMMDNLPRNRQ